MTITFNAVDVETANKDRSSICSIGIVQVRDGRITNEWQTLVNPEAWFDPHFTNEIHGIREGDVKHSPTLSMVYDKLCSLLCGSILVSHGSFDRIAFERAMEWYNLEPFQVTWLDSIKIVRRAWPEKYRRSGYGLKNVAKDLNISFRHHDALEDARTAAKIVLCACEATDMDIEGWLRRVKNRISSQISSSGIKREGNIDGALYGETTLFTGTLGILKREAANIAAAAGCTVVNNISRRVTMLVVGTQDRSRLKGYEKSAKHRKAEKLVEEGAEIQILSESDFFKLMESIDPLK